MRGLEYLDDQDETPVFQKIKHRPKTDKNAEADGQQRRKEGKIRRESNIVHNSKYAR